MSTNLEATTLDFLDADHVEWQEIVKRHDGVDDKLGKEMLLVSHELGAQCGGSALHQKLTVLDWVVLTANHHQKTEANIEPIG